MMNILFGIFIIESMTASQEILIKTHCGPFGFFDEKKFRFRDVKM